MKIVLASNNAKKLAELQALFDGARHRARAPGRPGRRRGRGAARTFVENALAKARHAARATGLPALADDSGLCVDALRRRAGRHLGALRAGRPGARRARRSARQDDANNALLLEQLHGVADRRAALHCTLVALRSPDDPEPLIADGPLARPRSSTRRAGEGGFGYDPLMFIPRSA